MDLKIILSPKTPGSINMATDWKLFQDFEKGLSPPTLRIYSWQPKCVSLGYSQDPGKISELEEWQEEGWDIVKRPTGGGIVFHDLNEVSYTVVMPRTKEWREAYRLISKAVVTGFKSLGIEVVTRNSEFGIRNSELCFETLNGYEITYKGEKLVGQAQRLGKKGLLQQGTIKTEILDREISFEDLSGALVRGFKNDNFGFD